MTLNPNSAFAWMASGIVSISQNRPDQAIAAFERAIRLSPLDPWGSRAFTFGLAWAHQAAGRYEEALNWADRALAAQPDYRPALGIKVVSSAHLGRIEEACHWLNRMLVLEPRFDDRWLHRKHEAPSAGTSGPVRRRLAQGRVARRVRRTLTPPASSLA